MFVQHIFLKNFRCHKHASWPLQQGVNLLIGPNGSGKTSFLEAVFIAVYGHSFRQSKTPDLVHFNEEEFQIDLQWLRYGPLHLQVKGNKKNIIRTLQGKKITIKKDFLRSFPIVFDSTVTSRFIDGTPNDRRKWLDALLFLCKPHLKHVYQNYLRAMMQRQRALRYNHHRDMLLIWESQMVEMGKVLSLEKIQLIEKINEKLADEMLCLNANVQFELAVDQNNLNEDWLNQLKNNRDSDKKLGRTQFGPHADKLSILFYGKDIRSIASRGQQKLVTIAIRLAECALRDYYQKSLPLLMLDDGLESLDSDYQYLLFQRLNLYLGQVLLTTPSVRDIGDDLRIQSYTIGESVSAVDGNVKRSSIMERAA